jgi:hypothetical protein
VTIVFLGGVVFVAGAAALAEAETASLGMATALVIEGTQALGWTSLLIIGAGVATASTGVMVATGNTSVRCS